MKKELKASFEKNKAAMTAKTARVGSYSFLMTLIVLGILIAVNVFVSLLPSKYTQFDISAAQLYSVTSATKAEVQNLNDDITIYWVVQSGEEDSVIEKLLDVYDGLSDHLTVVKKDPDVFPTFAANYTDDTVNNNSLIVECGERSRYIDYYDIYTEDTSSYYTTGSVSYSFDGEGLITTAIDYVTSEDLPVIYMVNGHGEADLSDTFAQALEKANIETETFSLLNVDEIPEEADAILINAPTTDFSTEEVEMLQSYVADGGHLIVLSGPQQDSDNCSLTNLDALLENYGVTVNDGILVEGSRDNYAFSMPYVLLPNLQSAEVTDPLLEEDSYVIVPLAQGLTIAENGNGTVTSLMDTSSDAFSKVEGYNISTYDKEDGDLDGPFSVAVAIEDNSEGRLIWIASDYLMDDTYNSYSAGANSDLVMNSVSWMIGESDAIAIRSKSMDYSYLTISDSISGMLKVWMIGIIPGFYLLFGILEVVARRKNQ